jgi:predicted protein tyrosine phosphatase
MQIFVMARSDACALEPEPGQHLISISTPGVRYESEPSYGFRTLALRFGDVSDALDEIAMQERDAISIWRFVEDVSPVDTLYIHCDAGMSRSVGVGVVLGQHFDVTPVFLAAGTDRHANAHVMAMLRRQYWRDYYDGLVT